MYKKIGPQLTLYDFVMPFSGVLSEENRWVRRAAELDWAAMEEQYSRQFTGRSGHVATPVRMVFGALVIRQALNLTDAETVRVITESPYLQYFIGLTDFTSEQPFSYRSLAAYRRRVPAEEVTKAVLRLRELNKQAK